MNKAELTIYDTMDRRIMFKVREINNDVRTKNTIVNRGEGYLYVIENTKIKRWFKVGMVTCKENIKARLNRYKHSIPVGEWKVLYLQLHTDIAIEELRMKHICRYKLGYEFAPNSKEWYNGNPIEAIKQFTTQIINESNLIPMRVKKQRGKMEQQSYYSKDEAKEYIRTLKNK
jgi:hypothetical protein